MTNKYFPITLRILVAIVFLLLFNPMGVSAQEVARTINGVVKNAKGYPMEGVVVSVQESTRIALSNEKGEFSIEAANNDVLSFSYAGFATQTFVVTPSITKLEIALNEQESLFGENGIIPVAYGTRTTHDITSAVSNVSGSRIEKRRDINLMNGLGGLVPGLIVMSNAWADTGSDPVLLVRGLKTTSSNNAPLILVDNIERSFSQLNPNEISSISVLKDAAALAIYGSKGANGVVLVTTKRGSSNKRDVIINAQMGMAEYERMPEYLNAYDYASLYNKALEMDGSSPKYTPDDLQEYKKVVDGVEGADPYRYPNNDFFDNYLQKTTKQQQYDLTMSGGNNTAQYLVFLGYTNQEGMYKYGDNSFNRLNFRSNVDIQVVKKLRMDLDIAGRLEHLNVPGGNYSYSMFQEFALTPSNAYPIFNEDGSLGGTTVYPRNPYGLMNKMGYRDQLERTFNTTLTFNLDLSDVLKGLSWIGRGGIDFRNQYVEQLTSGQFAVYELNPNGTYNKINNDDILTTNSWYGAKDRQFTFQTSFNYNREWEKHKVDGMLFFNMRDRKTMGTAAPYKYVNFAGQVQYRFLNRYLLEGTVCYSGSENFASGNRFGVFPAVSAGWVISEESFLKDNTTLSFLKLRASYGKTGLDATSSERFLYKETWGSASGYAFGTSGSGRGGTTLTRAGNNDLRWETSTKTNVGLDFGFFSNALQLSIDAFDDKRTDILVQKYATTPSMAGLELPWENGGEAQNRGLETSLAFEHQINKSWSFAVGGNFLYSKSKVLEVNEPYRVYDYQYRKGHPINQPFGYVSQGLFTQEEIDNGYGITQNGGNIRAGDIKYKDLNGDNIINGDDTKAIAKSSVPEMIAGFDATIRFKNFDLTGQLQGAFGQYVYTPGIYMTNFASGGNATKYAKQAWTPETAATAIYPRLSVNNNGNNTQYSDFWFKEASFVKLKALELGYTLPRDLTMKAGISKSRIYVNGYNLLTICGIKDYDPEDTGAAIYKYPFSKIVTLGLNVTF